MASQAFRRIQLVLMRQEKIANRAEEILEKALKNGEPFSEALCDWATKKAEAEISED